MKSIKTLIICGLIFILLIGMTACGNKSDVSSDEQAASQQEAVQQATDQQATVEEVIPTPEPEASADSLIGRWTDISYPDRFANITKAGDEYQYEDEDGKYPATFKDGVLKVKVSETDTADVYLDTKTGHMFLTYQEDVIEYEKK